MRRTSDLRAPMDTRTAISLVFSITIIMREIRIFSAATNTMRPIVKNVTTRSRRRARNNALFCSIQLVVINPWPAAFSSSWLTLGAVYHHDGANGRSQIVGQVLAQNDGRDFFRAAW